MRHLKAEPKGQIAQILGLYREIRYPSEPLRKIHAALNPNHGIRSGAQRWLELRLVTHINFVSGYEESLDSLWRNIMGPGIPSQLIYETFHYFEIGRVI